MKTYTKHFTQLSFTLFIVLILGGIIAYADSRPRLRIVHAAPEVQNVDIYVKDTIFFDNIFYGYISDYVPINDAPQKIEGRPAGTAPDFSPVTVKFDQDKIGAYEKNKDYTLIMTNKLGNPDAWNWRLEDNNDLPGTGTSRVRIVHASPDTPTTEFCLADVCYVLAFREQADYFLMDPGTYFPKVRLNGVGVTHIEIPPLVLQDNSVHTVFLTGQSQGRPGLQLLYTFDAGDAPPAHRPGNGPNTYPAPTYPPVTGVFLSPKLLGVIAGVVLVIVGGIGFWKTRK